MGKGRNDAKGLVSYSCKGGLKGGVSAQEGADQWEGQPQPLSLKIPLSSQFN